MAFIKKTTKFLLAELAKLGDETPTAELKKLSDEQLLEKLNTANDTGLLMSDIESKIAESAPDKGGARTSDDKPVYAYCCVHGGIRFNLKSGMVHLKSGNEVGVTNHFYNITLNPDKYSVTKITPDQHCEIKKLYGASKVLKNLFVFFASTPSLDSDQLKSVLATRGRSPWAQLSEAEIEKSGVHKKQDDE